MFHRDTSAHLSPDQRDRLVDAAVVGLSLLVGLLALFLDFEESVGSVAAVDVALVGAASVALLARRSWPLATAAGITALRLVSIVVSESEIALVTASIVAFYWVARTGRRRSVVYLAGIVAVVLSTAVVVAIDRGESFPQELLGESAGALLPLAVGDATRSREERLAAMIEAEASSRVQAERLRIARDLHDVVAHGLATIAVQSGTAAYNLDSDDPDDPVRVALERINATGKRSLEELRAMVGVLRSTDDAPVRPTPTDPNDLTDLTEAARMSDLSLSVSVTGDFPPDTAEATIVATHRIAQEALTNVARHAGPVATTLELRHHDDHLELSVVNRPPTQGRPDGGPAGSTGVGIVGMRERAESVGGVLDAQPTAGGGFAVRATLPYRQPRS